jgi:hypothetical protein
MVVTGEALLTLGDRINWRGLAHTGDYDPAHTERELYLRSCWVEGHFSNRICVSCKTVQKAAGAHFIHISLGEKTNRCSEMTGLVTSSKLQLSYALWVTQNTVTSNKTDMVPAK